MDESKSQVTCALCRGTGREQGRACRICRGAGTVALSAPTKRCAYCQGLGLQQRGTSLTCAVCGGVGWVTVEKDAITCPPCGGTGVEPPVLGDSHLPCLTCRGKGAISAERAKRLPPERRRPHRHRRGYGSHEVPLEY